MFTEVFSVPRVGTLSSDMETDSFDIHLGDDLLKPKAKGALWAHLHRKKPMTVGLSPPCTMFSSLQRCGRHREDPVSVIARARRMKEARALLKLSVEVTNFQMKHGRLFYFEHPWTASSWGLPEIQSVLKRESVYLSKFDQCAYGLKPPRGRPMRKTTGMMHNIPAMNARLNKRCVCPDKHDRIEGSMLGQKVSQWAQAYPKSMCKAIALSIQDQLRVEHTTLKVESVEKFNQMGADASDADDDDIRCLPCSPSPAVVSNFECFTDDDTDTSSICSMLDDHQVLAALQEEERNLPDQDRMDAKSCQTRGLPGSFVSNVQDLVQRAHEQMGHPGSHKLVRVLKLAKASPQVLDIARHLKCSTCQRQQRLAPQRRSAMPPPPEFNQVVGIGIFNIKSPDGSKNIPVLRVICWGTLYQQACVLKNKSASRVRRAYRKIWARVFGPPKGLVSDQGLEFVGKEFADRLETDGTMHVVVSAESPWQNARTERHGGVLKSMISKARTDFTPDNDDDLQEIVSACLDMKNRMISQHGFSPCQRVFEYNPPIPGSFIADGDRDPDISHLSRVAGGDHALIKAMNIRMAAAKAFAETDASERIRRAVLSGHRPVKNLSIGQRGFFWRTHGDLAALKAENVQDHWYGPATVVSIYIYIYIHIYIYISAQGCFGSDH